MKIAVLVIDEWETLYIDNELYCSSPCITNKLDLLIELKVAQWIVTSFAEDHPHLYRKYYYDPQMSDGLPGWLELPHSFPREEWEEIIGG